MSFLELAIEILPALLRGALVTLEIVSVSIVLGCGLGLVAGLCRVYGGRLSYSVTTVYCEAIRGTPLLVQLFFLYFGLPTVGIALSPFAAAVLGISINSGAYQAEYFRGAIQSIPAGQMLAARAIGLSKISAIRYIILPQMLRRVIPSWSNELMYMIKYSSVAYMVQAPELMAAGKEIAAENFRTFEVFIIVGTIYLIMVLVTSKLLDSAEARLRIPGL